jgi:cytochrome bd-type quinol oxidase subunit 2
MNLFFVNFWAAVLALGLLLYVVLDGFDLGVLVRPPPRRSVSRGRGLMSAGSTSKSARGIFACAGVGP